MQHPPQRNPPLQQLHTQAHHNLGQQQQQQQQQRDQLSGAEHTHSRNTTGSVPLEDFSAPRNNHPPSFQQLTQSNAISGFGGGLSLTIPSSPNNSGGSPMLSGLASGAGADTIGNHGFGNNSHNNTSSSRNDNNDNTITGFESLESLASLSVLSPTLSTPGGSGRRNSSSSTSTGYFSSSFHPPQSLPMIYQNQPIGPLSNNSNDGSGGGGGEHVVDNNDSNMNGSYYNQTTPSSSFQNTYYQNSTQDLLTSQQGQRKRQQGAYYQHQQQHQYQQYQQQQPSSSARSLPLPAYSTSSLSSSLPVYSTSLQQYSQQQRYRQPTVLSQQQQQDQFYRSLAQSSTQQQRYHQESIPLPHPTSQSVLSTSSFPHEGPPRARSKSLTVVTSTAMKTNTNADTAAVPPSNSGSQSASLETASSHEGGTKKVYIPARPRMIPPRPPQTSAPRKYHGRQIRKLSAPSINHYQVSGMQELVPPARRMAHIQSEQKRREKINAGFEELKSVIPECAQNTDSKATILRKAVDRILELEDELRKYTGEFHYVPEDSKEREE